MLVITAVSQLQAYSSVSSSAMLGLSEVVLHQRRPPGDIWQGMETFGLEGGRYWYQMGRGQVCYSTSSKAENRHLAQNVNGTEVEQPCRGSINLLTQTPLAAGFWFTFCQWETLEGERKHPSSRRGALGPAFSSPASCILLIKL